MNRTFMSFGGGVQSTAIALKLIYEPDFFQDLELPSFLIFADTGAETEQTYNHVEYMFKLLKKAGYSTITVKAQIKNEIETSILDDPINGRMGISTPPYFTKNDDGSTGMLYRQCTQEYKVIPIQRKIREILGYKPRRVIPKRSVKLWLGISIDEVCRVKDNQARWIQNHYPLIEREWDRCKCLDYCWNKLGYIVPKSACYFCPFTSHNEWVRRKQQEPDNFQLAVDFDKRLRSNGSFGGIKQKPYIHRSCYPLDEAIENQVLLPLGSDFGFANECSGHCHS